MRLPTSGKPSCENNYDYFYASKAALRIPINGLLDLGPALGFGLVFLRSRLVSVLENWPLYLEPSKVGKALSIYLSDTVTVSIQT